MSGDKTVPCVSVAAVAVEAATYAIDRPYDYIIPAKFAESVRVGVRVRVSFGRGNRKTEGIVLRVHETEPSEKLKPILTVLDEAPVLDERAMRLALWLREQCFCTYFDVVRTMLPTGLWYKYESLYAPSDGAVEAEAAAAVSGIENGGQIVKLLFNAKEPCKKQDIINAFGENDTDKVLARLTKLGYVRVSDNAVKNVSDKTERLVRLAVSREEAEDYVASKKPNAAAREVLKILAGIGVSSSKELCYFTGASPAQLKTLMKNGIVQFEQREIYRRPKLDKNKKSEPLVLNTMQAQAFSELSEKLFKTPSCALLYGVTGSGKTAVYFKLIESVLARKKTAILLVPEISLTPQLLEQVYAYFGDRTAVMHSALSIGERYDEWKRIKNGEVDVVVGTRSAIFAPLSNIGIIILDEEQESSYKSSSTPHYNARDVAKFRCVAESALLLLGSATPSVESMYSAKNGKYTLHTLATRFNERALPKVLIADMRHELAAGNDSPISSVLYRELAENISKGEQTILFLNRRGASRYAVCDSCGEVPGCPNCSVPLVYHSANQRFMCHHCGYSMPINNDCTSCGGELKFVGCGTQRVEEELARLFPELAVIRMDLDTTTAKASHETLLRRFHDENVPILLGTQMITKGLDFENVTLVGVISADQAIYAESYRAAENAFSLITQVVGRAGRGGKTGRAVIQSFSPNHPVIQFAAAQDYGSFYESELGFRKIRELPPFCDVFSIMIFGITESDALKGCMRVCGKLKNALKGEYADINARVLGPAPAGILRINGKYRYKISVCTENGRRARDLISRVIRDFMTDKQNKTLTIVSDINTTEF